MKSVVSCVFGYILCFCHGAVTTAAHCQELNSGQTVKDKTITNFITIYSFFLSFKHLIYHFAPITCVELHQLNLTLMILHNLCGKCQVPQSFSSFRKNSGHYRHIHEVDVQAGNCQRREHLQWIKTNYFHDHFSRMTPTYVKKHQGKMLCPLLGYRKRSQSCSRKREE